MKVPFKTAAAALVLASFALVGCTNTNSASDTAADSAPAGDTAADGTTVVFECPGGEIITAEFVGTEAAVVTLPDQDPITLAATEAASGARYSDGTTTFWNKGDEALVEVNDELVLSECVAQS